MSQFDLSRTLSWTRALQALAADDAATLAMLSDLQGNILKGHGRDHTANVFLTFKSGAAAAERGLRYRDRLRRAAADRAATSVRGDTAAQGHWRAAVRHR